MAITSKCSFYPRVLIELPIEFRMKDESNSNPGLVTNLSEAGLLIQTFKDMPVNTKIYVKILDPKNSGLPKLEVIAEIVWKDLYLWDDWEGCQYGMKFIQILNGKGLSFERFLLERSLFDQVLRGNNGGGVQDLMNWKCQFKEVSENGQFL